MVMPSNAASKSCFSIRSFIVGKSTCSMSMRAPTRLNMSCSSTAICWRCVLVPGTSSENRRGDPPLVTYAILAHHPPATLENCGRTVGRIREAAGVPDRTSRARR